MLNFRPCSRPRLGRVRFLRRARRPVFRRKLLRLGRAAARQAAAAGEPHATLTLGYGFVQPDFSPPVPANHYPPGAMRRPRQPRTLIAAYHTTHSLPHGPLRLPCTSSPPGEALERSFEPIPALPTRHADITADNPVLPLLRVLPPDASSHATAPANLS